jgi:hypothetical protein
MGISETIWSDPVEYLRSVGPNDPVMFLSPAALQAQARRFLDLCRQIEPARGDPDQSRRCRGSRL